MPGDGGQGHGLLVEDRVDWHSLERQTPWIIPTLRRVVEECAVNARRHGRSRSMIVEVMHAGEQLTLRCEDDGCGPGDSMAKGLGSRLFDEICADHAGEWALSRHGEATCFTLSLRVAELGDAREDASHRCPSDAP